MKAELLVNLFIAVLLVDIVIAIWLPPFFLTLSNLLFMEGGIAFSIGAFIAFALSAGRSSSRLTQEDADENREKGVRLSLTIMMIGGLLIAFSIIIGEVFIYGAPHIILFPIIPWRM